MLTMARLVPAFFVLLWATGFIGARYAMPWADPFTFLAWRFALTFAILAPLAMAAAGSALTWQAAAHAMVAGTLMHGVYLGGVFWAIAKGMPAGLAALVIGLQPLITAIMAGPALGERIRPRHWAGLVIGFTGVVLVLAPVEDTQGAVLDAAMIGATLIAVLGMSAGTIWQKRFGTQAHPISNAALQYVGGAIPVTLLALLIEEGRMELTWELVFAMAWLVLVLSIGAIFLLMYLIRHGEMGRVASLFYLVPGVTALLAWLLFDERLTVLQIAGMAVATLGVALATVQSPTRARASR
jgi:drug/metabolite transporter (DMT)-like permease